MTTLGTLYNDLKTLCKQWFYDKTESDGRYSPKELNNANYFVVTDSNKYLTTQEKLGNITKDGKVGTTANLPLITGTSGTITTGTFGSSANTFCQGNDSRLSDARTPTAHNQATSTITNSTAFDHIKSGESTTLTLDTQAKINDAINTKLGTLMEADIVVVTDNKGTASASTMNKLYLEAKSGGASGDGYNIWITVRTGTSPNYSYAWEKVDDFDLQTLSVAWANVTGKPSTFTPSSHNHGNIDNNGEIYNDTSIVDIHTNLVGLVGTYDTESPLGIHKMKYMDSLPTDFIKDSTAHSNIGSSANATQSTINGKIDDALATKITKVTTATGLLKDDGTVMTSGTGSTNWAVGNHTHNNITSDGKITQTVTNNGNLVVTNSSNQVGVESAIDVLDGIVNQLITYGT